MGEWLFVNCTSPNSSPAAELKWYINNEMVRTCRLSRTKKHNQKSAFLQVDRTYLVVSPPSKSAAGLYTATLGLRFRLKRSHFVQGHATLKCTATISTEYYDSSELFVPGIGLGEKALESRGTNGELIGDGGLCCGSLFFFFFLLILLLLPVIVCLPVCNE